MGTILIYGGSGDIGSAIARRSIEQGHQVHLAGRNEQALAKLAQELDCTFSVGDVKDHSFFQQATSDAGEGLSSLVYSVGTINLGSLQRLKAEDFVHDFNVNCLGAALAVKAAIKPMKKQGHGSIVFFSSVAAMQGFALHASMGTAKGAINGLTLSLAAELAPRIRVNAIAPSLTQTKLSQALLKNEQAQEQLSSMHPLKRIGTPDDIAGMAAYLISEEASWITGQIICVDGGRSTLRINS